MGAIAGHIVSFALFLCGQFLSLYIASGFIIVMSIDWSLQKFAHIPSTNFRRLITGFAGGIGVGMFIWTAIRFLYQNIKVFF